MQLQDDVRALGERLTKLKGSGAPPYIVVLGVGYAQAAGVPDLQDLASRLNETPEVVAQHADLLLDLDVPTFYQDLVGLAAAGSLPVILTTSYDHLFEQALFNAGLRANSHFNVDEAKASLGSDVSPSVRDRGGISVVRLFGLAPDDPLMADWLRRAIGIPDAPPVDLIMVGYEYESPALQRWLSKQGGGDLWWASEVPLVSGRLGWSGETHELAGDAGRPDTLFGQLSLLTLRLPTINLLNRADPSAAPSDDVDWLNRQYVQNQLQQVKVVKRAIEASTPAAGADAAVTSQLAYQRQEIGRLEGELRVPVNAAGQLLDRFKAARSRVQDSGDERGGGVDPDTVSFIENQIQVLEKELTKTEPSQLVLAAAEGALQAIESRSGIAAPDATSSAS
jgi:hypothetical protein